MISATQIRVGNILLIDGELFRVLKTHHVTPGKGNAVMQTELRSVKTGTKTEKRFRSTENVEKATMTTKEMEFLYEQDGDYHFMDSETYEQTHMTAEQVGNGTYYLQPNAKVMVELHEGSVLGLQLPQKVTLEVVECDPPLKGATATTSYKPAKVDNGLTVKVPPFINVGDKINVDTATNEYIDRA
jgi:elongation factor P